MSILKPIEKSGSLTYEAPKVSEETLDEGGNYVSPASAGGGAPNGAGRPGTLGNTIIE